MQINALNKRQAESFFKVMLGKKMSPDDIAETLTFCGALFVEYAETIAEAEKVEAN